MQGDAYLANANGYANQNWDIGNLTTSAGQSNVKVGDTANGDYRLTTSVYGTVGTGVTMNLTNAAMTLQSGAVVNSGARINVTAGNKLTVSNGATVTGAQFNASGSVVTTSALVAQQSGLLVGSNSGTGLTYVANAGNLGVDQNGATWSAIPAGTYPLTTQFIYSGQIYISTNGPVTVNGNFDDWESIAIDGKVITSGAMSDSTGTAYLGVGWHNLEIRVGNNSGNGGSNGAGVGIDLQGRGAASNLIRFMTSNGLQFQTPVATTTYNWGLLQLQGAGTAPPSAASWTA
jgi:hypothetical protein